MTVWVVVYSNYEPAEVDSLWTTEAEAAKRRDELNATSNTGMWESEPWVVRERWEPTDSQPGRSISS